jgi:hypothetical protein
MDQGAGLVEKQVFELPACTTMAGRSIERVRLGYETYGRQSIASNYAAACRDVPKGTLVIRERLL